MSRAVILLKSPPRDPGRDAYVQQLESAGYTPHFVDVLESVFSNEDILEDVVRTGPGNSPGFMGVVITSGRAAEAWVEALRKVEEPEDWSETPFYVVGESTSRILKQITATHPTKFAEALIRGAAQSGKSESLAQFVLADLPQARGSGRLLYLTGDKNRDIFQRIMSENDVGVESLMVYETRPRNDLEERITLTVQGIGKGEGRNQSTWLILFAPSSSDFVLPHLRKYFRLTNVGIPSGSILQNAQPELRAKLGAIGPTTAAFLRSEQFLQVDAVPEKPTAELLVASLRECDAKDTALG